MLAKEYYDKIIELCDAIQVVRSGKKAKDNLYRSIKCYGAAYKDKAYEERIKSGSSRVSDDEVKIHMMTAVVKKDAISDAMTFDEFRNHIITATTAIINM